MEAFLQDILGTVVNIAITIFEFMGVGVIIISGLSGIVSYI